MNNYETFRDEMLSCFREIVIGFALYPHRAMGMTHGQRVNIMDNFSKP